MPSAQRRRITTRVCCCMVCIASLCGRMVGRSTMIADRLSIRVWLISIFQSVPLARLWERGGRGGGGGGGGEGGVQPVGFCFVFFFFSPPPPPPPPRGGGGGSG